MLLLIQLGCSTQVNPVALREHLECSQAARSFMAKRVNVNLPLWGDPEGEQSAAICMEECLEAMSKVNSCDSPRHFGYTITRPINQISNLGKEECTRDAGDYNSNEKVSSSQTVELENRAQAELWMECIGEKSCEMIRSTEGRFCAPIWGGIKASGSPEASI